jgi:hypothetical protein
MSLIDIVVITSAIALIIPVEADPEPVSSLGRPIIVAVGRTVLTKKAGPQPLRRRST